jgi:hypothetical protein
VDLADANSNQLGLDCNAPGVGSHIVGGINDFRYSKNPAGVPAAGVQADVVGHSMGGLMARWANVLGSGTANYGTNSNGASERIHKLITVGTPHFGSNWATQVLSDPCFQALYATIGQITFGRTVTLASGATTAGALWDLQGNAKGDGLGADNGLGPDLDGSSLDKDMQQLESCAANGCGIPTVEIAGKTDWHNLSAISPEMLVAGFAGVASCPAGSMWKYLSPASWNDIFNNTPNDAIVSVTSQLAGRTNAGLPVRSPLIHTNSLTGLGFAGPAEIDPYGPIYNDVINALNGFVSAFSLL